MRHVTTCGLVAKLYSTLGIPPGSSIHGVYWAKILEWVAISSSGGFSWPRDPVLQADSLLTELLGTDQRSGSKTAKRSLWLKNHWKRKRARSGASTKSGNQWGNTGLIWGWPAFLLAELWRSLSLENCETCGLIFPRSMSPTVLWNI